MPTFHFPFFYNPNYYRHMQNRQVNFNNNMSHQSGHSVGFDGHTLSHKSEYNKNFDTHTTSHQNNSTKKETNSDDSYFFEIFGLKLYFDDILLITLIFFLYEEGVRDDELFISLILLLLS